MQVFKRVSSFLWIQFSVTIKSNELIHAKNDEIVKVGSFGFKR